MREHNESKLRVIKTADPALQGSRHVQPFDNDTQSSTKFTVDNSSIELLAPTQKNLIMLNLLILCRAVFVASFSVAPGYPCSEAGQGKAAGSS